MSLGRPDPRPPTVGRSAEARRLFPRDDEALAPFEEAVAGGRGRSETPRIDDVPGLLTNEYGAPRPKADEPPPPRDRVEDLDGLAAAVCACIERLGDRLLEELPDKIAKRIEARQVTSRGAQVRPPATCAQPVRSTDVDDQVLGMDLPASDADGVKRCVLKRVATQSAVLKGLNWEFAVDASVKDPSDPADQLVVHVLVDGNPVGTTLQGDDQPTGGKRTRSAYFHQSRPPAPGGIDELAASQIYVTEGQCVELIAERIAHPASKTRIDYKISARWKGWEWTPPMHADGAIGAAGF